MSHAVAVIIPAYHAAQVVGDALRSVDGQAHVTEICVACHDDATRNAAKRFTPSDPDVIVTVIDNPSGTTPDALNAAIAHTSAPYIARLDAHATFTPGYIDAAIDVLSTDETIANVGGIQQARATKPFQRAVAASLTSLAGSGGATYRTGGAASDADTVYLGVFRRSALTAVHGYNPACLRNQDAELNIRLKQAGYRIRFDPRLIATYTPRATVPALARQYHDYGRWRRYTHRATRTRYAARQLLVPAAITTVAASLLLAAVTANPKWLVIGAGYLAAVTLAASHAAATHPDTRLSDTPRVAVALIVMHVCWASGFLRGSPHKVTP